MKRKNIICSVFSIITAAVFILTGCSASQPETTPTVLTAYNEAVEVPVSIASIEPVETPEPEPTPTAAAQTDIPQLNLNGNFMAAKSIDGIDPYNDKVVALTFDDGPHPENTDKLLNILAENDAVATFFVLGENAERYPDVIERIYAGGNEIGTHSYSHTDLMKLSLDEIMSNEYGKTNDVLEGIIGVRAAIDRPPYGSMSDDRAAEIGREQILWSVDPEDWKDEYKSTSSLMDNIFNGTNSGVKVSDGAIILSHDIHATTVDAYDTIIKELKAQGYKFVTITQMMQIAELRGKDLGYKFNGAPSAENAAAVSEEPAETAEA